MSEKRSWDIAPRRSSGTGRSAPAKRPAPDVELVGRVQPRGSRAAHESLRKRRSRGRRRLAAVWLALLAILVAGAFYLLWQPYLRVQQIGVSGYASQTAPAAARAALQGTYFKVVPRDSIFFLPKQSVMDAVMRSDANIAAVSVSRSGLTTIALAIIPRAGSYAWCGGSVASSTEGVLCYQADSTGTLFALAQIVNASQGAAAATSSATSTMASSGASAVRTADGSLMVYAPLATSTGSLLGSTIADAAAIPAALRFARAIDSLGAHAVSIQLRGDEADVFLTGGTRVTYVLGQEQAAADAAAAAFPQLDLGDGSVQYVDLRFAGKAYVKKVGS